MASSPRPHLLPLLAALLAAGCDGEAETTVELGTAATSAQIQAARSAPDASGLDLPIQGAFVTHVRAAVGADSAGFAVQSQRAGPALFVAVDPATLDPVPVAGDQVDLTVTAMGTEASRREALAVSGWAVVATGVDVSSLQKDLSYAGDLVSDLDAYESELARVTGDLRSGFSGSGSGFVAAGLDTAALQLEPLLVFRLPTTLRDELDLALGCRVTVAAVPIWRSDATAQATAWTAADLEVVSCPAPRLLSAVALSSTVVRATFDRVIDPATVVADGGQFAFTGGLVATAAAVSDTVATITTEPQSGSATYTLTVAASVRDLYGAGVDPAFDEAAFAGYVAPALLVLNEVNASVAGGADLVELRALSAGSVRDTVLQVGVGTPSVLATLPDLEVAQGDLIVVHLSPPAGVVTETTASDACADSACYPGAWDVTGGAQGINDSTRILAVRTALGILQDAVPFTDGSDAGVIGTFVADLQDLQAMGLWLPADCGGEPCTFATSPTALEVSAGWEGMGAAADGVSVRRAAGPDADVAADWSVGASSFGAGN